MADKIDMIFKDYFSGTLANKIAYRKYELSQDIGSDDENIGGGKLENVNSQQISVENKIIRIEDDLKLNHLIDQYESVRNFVAICDLDLRNMLDYWYDERKHYLWAKVTTLVYKSERQCRYDVRNAKYKYMLNNIHI